MKDNVIILSEDQKKLIERLGVVYETNGLQPAASRVLSLLLVSDETELTFDQILTTLSLSKSATSNAINMLLTTNKIAYITKMGDRKRYFKSKVMHWKEQLIGDLDKLDKLTDLLKLVLKQRPGDTVEFNNNLKEVIDFIDFLHGEIPAIYEKWEKKKR